MPPAQEGAYKPPLVTLPSEEALLQTCADQPDGAPSPELIFLQPGATLTRCDNTEEDKASRRFAYANGDGTEFRVRYGANYKSTGRKEPSLDAMYDVVAVDLYRTEERIFPFTKIMNLPPVQPWARDFKHPHVPPIFVMNFQVPNLPASMFSSEDNGPSMQIIMVYHIRQESIAAFNDLANASTGHRLFAKWCEVGTTDEKFRSRFKLIGVMDNFRKLGMPTLLERYNGKPTMISKTGTLVKGKDTAFLEMSVNVHLFPYIARRSIWSLKHKMREMLGHVGAVIESRSDDEQPERVVFCTRLLRADGWACPQLSNATVAWLRKQADALKHNEVVASSARPE